MNICTSFVSRVFQNVALVLVLSVAFSSEGFCETDKRQKKELTKQQTLDYIASKMSYCKSPMGPNPTSVSISGSLLILHYINPSNMGAGYWIAQKNSIPLERISGVFVSNNHSLFLNFGDKVVTTETKYDFGVDTKVSESFLCDFEDPKLADRLSNALGHFKKIENSEPDPFE